MKKHILACFLSLMPLYFRALWVRVGSPQGTFLKMAIERILVVDDEEPIREIISSMLSAAGYHTRQAASGMEALAILNSTGEFELMLSDLMMAELDGIALLERSKEKYP